jgi:diguanylate cyclase (GGDEF)-like protein
VPANELVGRRRWEIPSVFPDEEGWRTHRATLDAHLPFRDFELARRGSDGNLRYFSLSGEPVFDAGGAFIGYRGVGREITEQKTAELRLDRLAHYDMLTGLPNRALLHDRMRQAMARADRERTLLAVMFLDLDRFKEINDSLGHAAGDEVLKEAARRLQSCLRSTDTVARPGGDEFTVLLEDVHHVDEVSAVARKILDAFAEPAEVAGHELHLSTSIGVTLYPLDDQDADTLLKNADIAMYQAKQEGRNNFQFFAADMGARTERHADLRLRLHHALERGEFALHYQPQVALAGGGIFGVEALLRWNDAELGPVPPGQFIPVAEEMGLIVTIGDWVLREACRQCKLWLEAGLGPLRVAVNLSPRQFRQRKLARRIGEILRETGLPAACLEIEITEGIVMKHAERAITTLTELNRLGVQIAIDDFGTGYSSLAYLQRFPVHVLKIDQSFVQAIRGGTDEAAIVNTVIHLAKLLGLKALAEGVETAEQREYLRAHGCDAFQGFLSCKPQPAQHIGELLAAHRGEKVSA